MTKQPPPPPPTPTRVVVSPATATLHRGDTLAFTATVSGQTDQTVTWSVASGRSIDSAGLYTAPSSVDGASVVVTATSTVKPTANGTATVTLPTVPFFITPAAIAVAPSATHTFSATITGLSSNQVNWAVQGTGGGTISNAGLYTAPAVIGTVHLIATSKAKSKLHCRSRSGRNEQSPLLLAYGRPAACPGIHTATLLQANGKVLVAGSGNQDGYCLNGISSAELYDPVADSFAPTGVMTIGRYTNSTLLPNGKVLSDRWFLFRVRLPWSGNYPRLLTTARTVRPLQWIICGDWQSCKDRGGHTATLLTNGKVLIAVEGKSVETNLHFLEIASSWGRCLRSRNWCIHFDREHGTGRAGQTATLLGDGKVLITGGWTGSQPTQQRNSTTQGPEHSA